MNSNKCLSRRTCFAVVAGVTINTDTRVPVHIVGTTTTILTRAAVTLVDVCTNTSLCRHNIIIITYTCTTSNG